MCHEAADTLGLVALPGGSASAEEVSASVASGSPKSSTTSIGGPCERSSGITKYTRLHRPHTTADSRVGPDAGPGLPCRATGSPQAQCHVAQRPITLARFAGRFISRSGMWRIFGNAEDTSPVTAPRGRSYIPALKIPAAPAWCAAPWRDVPEASGNEAGGIGPRERVVPLERAGAIATVQPSS